ncbi:MAG: hypothetical protein ACLQME_21260 [Alphaproteobacteria bacterium]
MKSKALSVTTLPERFTKDLAVFENISDDTIQKLTPVFVEIEKSGQKDTNTLALRLSESGISGSVFNSFLSAVYFGNFMLARFNDKVDDLVDDLIESKHLSKEAGDKYLQTLKTIAELGVVTPSFEFQFRGSLPLMITMEIECLILPTFTANPDKTAKDQKDEYKIAALQPVILVNVTTTLERDDGVSFVLTEVETVNMIRELEIARRKLEQLKTRLGK